MASRRGTLHRTSRTRASGRISGARRELRVSAVNGPTDRNCTRAGRARGEALTVDRAAYLLCKLTTRIDMVVVVVALAMVLAR